MSGIKDYLPHSLFGRTLLIIMVPVLLLQIAVSVVFFDRHWTKMSQRLAFAVSGEISAAIHEIDRYAGDTERNARIIEVMNRYLELKIEYDPERDSLDESMNSPRFGVAQDFSQALNSELEYPYTLTVFRGEKRVVVDILLEHGVVTVTVPEGRLFSSSSYIFILWMIGLSVFFFTVSLIFMRNQIRPIHRLGIAADRMGRGMSVGKFKPSGAYEVRQAAEAFIKMHERIQHYIRQRTAMLAGVSHDLKTPLTRMKLQLEMMGDTPDVDAMKTDIQDMERMIEGYLSFAKGEGDEEIHRISLETFLDKITDNARRMNLHVDEKRLYEGEPVFWGKPNALERAFTNFVANSDKYANSLLMTAQADENTITIMIEDNGPGIDDNLMQEVIKPFVRGEPSRNRKTGGVGLGLTIANDIITSHAGSLVIEKSDNLGGLKVTVTIPL